MDINTLKKYKVPDFVIEKFKKQNITELNPAQLKAIKQGLFNNNNLLVCTPTGSGKTAIATFAITKRLAEQAENTSEETMRDYVNETIRILYIEGAIERL